MTSKLTVKLCHLLNIHALRTSVYHPQTDGLEERFNRTLKMMMRQFTEDDLSTGISYCQHCSLRCEVPQVYTSFSQYEFLYGSQPRGILDLLRET